MKKFGKLLILFVVIGGSGFGLVWYWNQQRIYPSTDDAYINANIVTISPQVSGRVIDVTVAEAGPVQTGDTMVRLDPAGFQAAVDVAAAQLETAGQGAHADMSQLAAAEAALQVAQTALADAISAYQRSETLFAKKIIAQTALDDALSARDQASARVKQAEASLQIVKDQAGASGNANAAVRAAQANLDLAQLALDHTVITAPATGWIANLSLRPGEVVNAGQPLFSIIEDGDWWVDAHFSETDLQRIRVGQTVTLDVDMYPGLTLHGTVDSLGAGSGSVFSLLPAQNASGNWVKVTQRFPVRIKIEKPSDPTYQLRVGASVTATVDTSDLVAK